MSKRKEMDSDHEGRPIEIDTSRFFHNRLDDKEGTLKSLRDYGVVTERTAQLIIDANVPSKEERCEVYTGQGGLTYAFWRLSKQHKHFAALLSQAGKADSAQTHTQKSTNYLQIASNYQFKCEARVKARPDSRFNNEVTFFCGAAAVWAMGALLRQDSGDAKLANEVKVCIGNLMTMMPDEEDNALPNELLYGRAGYLWTLLFLQHHLRTDDTEIKQSLAKGVDDVFTQIYKKGKDYSIRNHFNLQGCPLMYEWHRATYLGGAHGVGGIVYTMLDVPHKWRKNEELRHDMEQTIDWLLTVRMPSGNYPPSAHDPRTSNRSSDRLVHWCHGAPSLAMLFAKAAQTPGFGDEQQKQKWLRAAVDAGQVVWERGLLKKGVGLCHGISGNAYVMWALATASGDQKWARRANLFAEFGLQHGPSSLTEKDGKGSSKLTALWSTPDEPWCLMNGVTGALCLYADMALRQGESDVALTSVPAFPAWDLHV